MLHVKLVAGACAGTVFPIRYDPCSVILFKSEVIFSTYPLLGSMLVYGIVQLVLFKILFHKVIPSVLVNKV